MNIAAILEEQARARPHAIALVEKRDRQTTFQDLWRATGKCAELLRASGLSRGDGVLLLHPISSDLYIFLIALFRIGAVGLILDPSAGMDHVERCCKMWPPKAFFGSRKAHLLRFASRALRRTPLQFSSGWMFGARNIHSADVMSEIQGSAELSDSDPAIVTFTSGSTGPPKAAVRSHGFLVAQYRALLQSLHLAPGRVDLTTLPIFVLANLAAGVTSVLPDADMRRPGAVEPKKILRQIRQQSVESMAASPAFVGRIADHLQSTEETVSSVRKIFIGGAPVFPRLLQRCTDSFPTANVTAVYGSTEAEPMAEIGAAEISDDDLRTMASGRGLLAGRPVPSLELRVIRDQWGHPLGRLSQSSFDSFEQPPEGPGEIVVSGQHVLHGYLNGDGDEETKFDVDGVRWHRTGDLGYFDLLGRLWLLGRCSAKIEDERGTLYPFSVECAAQQNEWVELAALVAHNGQRILSVQIIGGRAFRESELLKQLGWAQLDRVLVLDRIPLDRRHNAKVDYPVLRRQLDRALQRTRS